MPIKPVEGFFGAERARHGNVKVMPIRADDREMWARQPDEPLKTFRIFEVYLNLPEADRTYRAVAAATPHTSVWAGTMSKRWSWKARVSAWGEHCDKAARAEDLKAVLDMRRAQRIAGQKMRTIGFSELEKIEKKIEAGKDLTVNETRLMIDAGFKHEAAALGQSSAPEEVQHKFDGINVDKLTDEQLHRIVVNGEDPKKVLAAEISAMDGMLH
jgi:hypothetical protein